MGASLSTRIKCASKQWKYPSSPSHLTEKFKVTPSDGRFMLTVFWVLREYFYPVFRSMVKM
jgi:hypothetical protein